MNKKDNDLDSIMADLETSGKKSPAEESPKQRAEPVAEATEPVSESEPNTSLWKEFLEYLDESKQQDNVGCRRYEIDDDIIFTLHQCDFGKSNAQVINSILRTFLVANIDAVRKYIVKRPSLFDIVNKG